MTREEKSKFEFEEKKFSLLLKVASQAWNAHKPPFSVRNWTFFPRIQILIFLRESTQNDHIRLLYKFENYQKKFGCVGSCGYAPASVKWHQRHFIVNYVSFFSFWLNILITHHHTQKQQHGTYTAKWEILVKLQIDCSKPIKYSFSSSFFWLIIITTCLLDSRKTRRWALT